MAPADVSLIPPRIVARARKLPRAERREYIQTRMGSLEVSMVRLKNRAIDIAEEWEYQQREHTLKVIAQYRAWLED